MSARGTATNPANSSFLSASRRASQPHRVHRHGTTKLLAIVGIAASVLMGPSSECRAAAAPAALQPAGMKLPPELKDPTNAALRHYRAWGVTTTETLKAFGELWESEKELTPGWKPSEKLVTNLTALNDYVNLAFRAAQLRTADWGIEYSDGWQAILPHLGKLREEARVLEMQARVLLATGTGEERVRGVRMLAALFRLPAHLTGDQTLISVLVAEAIASRAADVALALAEQGVLTAAERTVVAASVRELGDPSKPGADLFGLSRCIKMEQWMAASLFDKSGPDAGKHAAEVAKQFQAMSDPKIGAAADTLSGKIAKLDESGLKADVKRHAEFYAAVVAIIAAGAPDAVAQMKDLETRVANGEFGLTLQATVPQFSRCVESDAKVHGKLVELIKRLEAQGTK